jgi:hypothetical protein
MPHRPQNMYLFVQIFALLSAREKWLFLAIHLLLRRIISAGIIRQFVAENESHNIRFLRTPSNKIWYNNSLELTRRVNILEDTSAFRKNVWAPLMSVLYIHAFLIRNILVWFSYWGSLLNVTEISAILMDMKRFIIALYSAIVHVLIHCCDQCLDKYTGWISMIREIKSRCKFLDE